jgi:hypothetical protein
MISFRLALSIGSLGLLATSLSSCLKAPEYPDTPSISFNTIQDIRIPPKARGGQPLDSIRMTINYQDGDGDLGLTENDRKSPPFDYQTGTNRFYNNFFVEPFVKNTATGKYESLVSRGLTTAGQYNGAFPRPTTTTDNKAAPIKGTLTYAPIAFGLGDVFQPGQIVRFEITIADRKLHLSNTIRTDSVVIPPR